MRAKEENYDNWNYNKKNKYHCAYNDKLSRRMETIGTIIKKNMYHFTYNEKINRKSA